MSVPTSNGITSVKFMIDFGSSLGVDQGRLFTHLEFYGSVNSGYVVKVLLTDNEYELLDKLIEDGIFKAARSTPVPVRFQIFTGDTPKYPDNATKLQTAIITSVRTVTFGQMAKIEVTAVDPATWYLNVGDASGSVHKGRVDQVIRKVVSKYAPQVQLDTVTTSDSEQGRWPMARQDPKSFISSLLKWSSPFTKSKTDWLIGMDGDRLSIKDQASVPFRQRAFYRHFGSDEFSSILNASIDMNCQLASMHGSFVTAGASAVSGAYIDGHSAVAKVDDKATDSKVVAKTDSYQSFTSGGRGAGVGSTFIRSIPELSGGDAGLPYTQYIDGVARGDWLRMYGSNLMKTKINVLGHGEWSDTIGLGVDSVYLKWATGRNNGDGRKLWWMTGSWLVHGFHHVAKLGSWMTTLTISRHDNDAAGIRSGG